MDEELLFVPTRNRETRASWLARSQRRSGRPMLKGENQFQFVPTPVTWRWRW
jgi:hypothetical protein